MVFTKKRGERPATTTAEDVDVVHLVESWAPLLSGGLSDCQTPDDESCIGGVAAVAAHLRNCCEGQPTVVVPLLDTSSTFVQMHPLGWGVNRLVMNQMLGWKVFASSPSLLLQNSVDYEVSQRDISDLQSDDFLFLNSNANVPPSNSWYPYTIPVHFDDRSGLAILSISNSDEPLLTPQIEATIGTLNYVARLNSETGCTPNTSIYQSYLNQSIETDGDHPNGRRCWISVIYYSDIEAHLQAFLGVIPGHTNPPALIIDLDGTQSDYSTPRRIDGTNVWFVSHLMNGSKYSQHVLTVARDGRSFSNVEHVVKDLSEPVPAELKDDIFATHINSLRKLADEALVHDPVVGRSLSMPISRSGNYRRCKSGECEIGNLFTDAARWYTDADVAFVTSGGLRGLGWPAGEVKVSHLWEALPFPNTLCTGEMTGVSLFNLFNYSISAATFEGEETEQGGRLLQVSGANILYNTELSGSRLISIDVWDKEQQQYLPIDRMKLYRFVTDSYVCGAYDPYPALLGSNLIMMGEQQGKIGDASHQMVVADYLSQLSDIYDTTLQGRLVNNTSATDVLDLVQTPEKCKPSDFWVAERFSCVTCPPSSYWDTPKSKCESCPNTTEVLFGLETMELDGESGSILFPIGKTSITNNAQSSVSIALKSMPSWAAVMDASIDDQVGLDFVVDGPSVTLGPGQEMTIEVCANSATLEPGTALGTMTFDVLDSNYPGCLEHNLSMDVLVRVDPPPDLNQLGSIRIFGWTVGAVAFLTAGMLAIWVVQNRRLRLVRTMQPLFLVVICFGVLLMTAGIIPMSMDDEIFPEQVCHVACMATPWLLSTGFVITTSALFSKLWRINKLLQGQIRRKTVREKDVMGPPTIIVSINFILLVLVTALRPFRWERRPINGEDWNTIGSCTAQYDAVYYTVISLILILNAGTLILACYQAYRARNISDEFSESKNLGVALFGSLQVVLVGSPVLFMIDADNPRASYLLKVGILFALCMSFLLIIFVPMLIQVYRIENMEGHVGAVSRTSGGLPSYSTADVGTTRISGLQQPDFEGSFSNSNTALNHIEEINLPSDETAAGTTSLPSPEQPRPTSNTRAGCLRRLSTCSEGSERSGANGSVDLP